MAREMKDSGVEWIGQIPKEWKLGKYKYFSENRMGETILAEEVTTEGIPIYSATLDDTIFGYIKTPKLILNKNDFVIPARGNSIGSVTIVKDEQATCTQTTICSKNIRNININYLYFCCIGLKDNWFKYEGSAIPQITVSQIKNNILPIPSLKEQEKIANYLDKKVMDIDLIIEKTKATIKDYKKYKQSIITEAVTKGLNPNVEVKDSGIEWIGQIPKHWEVSRIQHLFEVIDERNTDPNAQLLSLYTAIGVKPRADLEEKGNKAVTVINYKKVKINDIIVNKLLAWMGAIGYSDYEGVTSPDYDIYRAKKGKPVNRNFFNNYFRYTQFKGDCFKYGYGIMLMRWRTYSEQFLRLKVPVPPLEEQQQIAEYLDKKIAEIDNLIAKKESLISEMEEYKKSLIYECVTGKKEII